MGTSRLPLSALRVLEAVGRHASLARAAEELHVEPSAVSMQMKVLSEYVGTPMLRRSGRGVALTPAAQQLLPGVSEGLLKIEEALRTVRKGQVRATFSLSVLPSFLILWLLPRVPELNRLCASRGRALTVSASRANVELLSGEYQGAIRLGDGHWPGVLAEKLMDETLIPVCAPSLARSIGKVTPGSVPDGVPLLNSALDSWSRWGVPDSDGAATASAVMVDDAVAVILSAERGLGLALARGALAAGSLAAGRLRQIGPAIPYRHSYYWVTQKSQADDPLAREVFDCLLASVDAAS